MHTDYSDVFMRNKQSTKNLNANQTEQSRLNGVSGKTCDLHKIQYLQNVAKNAGVGFGHPLLQLWKLRFSFPNLIFSQQQEKKHWRGGSPKVTKPSPSAITATKQPLRYQCLSPPMPGNREEKESLFHQRGISLNQVSLLWPVHLSGC